MHLGSSYFKILDQVFDIALELHTFAPSSLWGKYGGLYTCAATFSYIVPLPNIFLTRLFSKRRLKRKDFQEILRLPWAQEAPGSNPGAPTKSSPVFESDVHCNTHLWNSGRLEFSIRKSFSFREFATRRICKNKRRQERYSETIERKQVKRTPIFGNANR
jgi:hypothetical protein